MKIRTLLLSQLLVLSVSAQTNLHFWRMGENDSGAASGNAVNSTLTADTGTNLNLSGSGLTYSSTTPGAGSSLAVQFGGSGNYATGSNFSLASDFAIEAWVKLGDINTAQWITLLGHGANNGIGLFVSGDFVGMALAGTGMLQSVSATNNYVHVAIVAQGTDASFYYNGAVVGTATSLPTLQSNFSIGGDENGSGRLTSNALVDHVRVFTFGNGTFSTSMFSYPASAIPEPSAYAALAGALALGLAAWRRRRASA
jgi:hypothetical protein